MTTATRNCSSRLTGPFWGVCDCGLNCDTQPVQPQLHAFQVQIKRGAQVRLSLPVMGTDSITVAEQHECLCERGEVVVVKPAGVRS